MNEFELALPDKDGFEQMLAGLKPATPVVYDFDERAFVISKDEDVISNYSNGFDSFKSSLRDIYDFGNTVIRGVPKLLYLLRNIYNCLKYVETQEPVYLGKPEGYDLLGINPSMQHTKDVSFLKLTSYFGISDTSAYVYKNLGTLVSPETLDFYPRFSGYSLSLLTEMHSYIKECEGLSNIDVKLYQFEDLTIVVPKDTTVQAMRYYRKIMALWRKRKDPFQYDDVRCKIDTHTKVSDVIDYYDKLIQEQEQNKLKALTAKVESKDKPKAEELVGNDVLIKQLREQITELKKTTVPNLGNCDGCVYSGVNLNKCRCCRRYKDLKDLFKSE